MKMFVFIDICRYLTCKKRYSKMVENKDAVFYVEFENEQKKEKNI
jgi:hypothetical protein